MFVFFSSSSSLDFRRLLFYSSSCLMFSIMMPTDVRQYGNRKRSNICEVRIHTRNQSCFL